jgi:hypothetical protein
MSYPPTAPARRYIVGIRYISKGEDKGYFDIKRTVTLSELAKEIQGYLVHGKTSFPAFSSSADPEVLFAWALDDGEDGDCYPELMTAIDKIMKGGG